MATITLIEKSIKQFYEDPLVSVDDKIYHLGELAVFCETLYENIIREEEEKMSRRREERLGSIRLD